MFYLYSRVHFNEIVLSCFVYQELHCAGTSVVNCLCYLYRIVADGLSLLICQAESRCKFDYLLVSSLDGTVSLIKVNDVSFLVSQNLNFYMFRVFKIFFNENIIYTEGFCRFTSGTSELWKEFVLGTDNSHTSSAAACCRLEHYRVAAAFRKLQSFFFGLNGLFNARNSGNAY